MDQNKPSGGFPPIFLCNEKQPVIVPTSTKREFKSSSSHLDLKKILENRRT